MGRGVGEDVRQGAKLQAGAAGHSEPAGGQQRPDLADRAGDRGAVHPAELCQCRVRELKAQRHQGHDNAVGEHEFVVRACSRRTQTLVTPALTQPGLLRSHPGASQLSDEFAEAPRLEAGEDTLGQGRAAQVMRHNITQAARPASCHDNAAIVIAHHVVTDLLALAPLLSHATARTGRLAPRY